MSNEELVSRIQNGENEHIEPLWWAVERFIRSRAGYVASVLSARYGVTFDDLYNSGFIAMIKAVETYKADAGMNFLSWLAYYLRTEFAITAGYRTKKIITLNHCASLDAPIKGADDETTLGELIADPKEYYTASNERIYNAQLREVLQEVISAIDEEQRAVIEQHYFQGVELSEIDKSNGAKKYTAKLQHDKALKSIQKKVYATSAGARLRAFVDENSSFYKHSSVAAFLSSGTSAVEKVVFERERLARQAVKDGEIKGIWLHV